MTIEAGDWIRVPKGTHLVKDYGKGHYGAGKAPTSREVVVQVSSVDTISDACFLDQLSAEHYAEYRQGIRDSYGMSTWGGGHTDKTRAEARDRWQANYDLALSRLPNGATRMVHWSNDKKAALDAAVEKVAAPAPRKKAEPKINKRQQMVNKSRWKFTQDHDVTYVVPNPAIRAGEQVWEKANPRPKPIHGIQTINGTAVFKTYTREEADAERKADDEWRKALFAERARLEDQLGKMTTVVHRQIKAGEVFTVDGKFQTYNPYGYGAEDAGIIARVKFDGDDKNTWLPYKQVVDLIQAESIPTVDVYVLRQKSTGLMYRAPVYSEQKTREVREAKRKELGLAPGEPVSSNYQYNDDFTDTFMKAKHFDGLGRAKTQILMMTGYYDGLPGADESLPEWAGNSSGFTMSEDWELVHFDKLARKEVEVVSDFQEWYARSWQLRELTVRYGSSVRTAYKALEKANLLDTQKGMMVFTVTNEDALDNVSHYDDKTAVTKEDQNLIDEAIASRGMKRGSFKKATDHKSVAVTFPDKGTAMMFKLAYSGKLKTTVLDLETLKEAVDG